LSGGGERVTAAWRFWPHRHRVAASLRAPAPPGIGGTWGVDLARESSAFTAIVPGTTRTSARLSIGDWATARVRWDVAAGLDRWEAGPARPAVSATLRWLSLGERVDIRGGAAAWFAADAFATQSVALRARSSVRQTGPAFEVSGAMEFASTGTPAELQAAGDTGQARRTLLRAHPVLDHGLLRVDRLGRLLTGISAEPQFWWRLRGGIRVAAAAFVDAARTGRRLAGAPRIDVDAGIGARLVLPFVPGVFRTDIGKGLADGATAWSLVYAP
jgi:hypothetical protein